MVVCEHFEEGSTFVFDQHIALQKNDTACAIPSQLGKRGRFSKVSLHQITKEDANLSY